MSDTYFSSEFSTGFQIACGAITALSVIRMAPYLVAFLFYIPVALVDLITAPARRAEQRRKDALAREATEQEAKRLGFASAEAFENYLDILRFCPGYVSPSSVMTPEKYTRPRAKT